MMRSFLRLPVVRRRLKVACLTAVVGGSLTLLVYSNDWEVSTIGAIRFGRAAWAAASIAADYHYNLHRADVNSSDYGLVKSEIHQRSAERLRDLCYRNGGVFVKVGQHIGSLDYLLPPEYVKTMKIFHTDAPRSDLSDLFRVVEEDLGQKASDIFTTFDTDPLGVASLAQVHRATLKDGRVVAVKVQHPRVKSHSFIDIKTMEVLARLAAWLFPDFPYIWLAEETKKNLPIELDFINEGQNCEQISRQLRHLNFFSVPKIHWELSSERVLTMEFCTGGRVDDVQYMKQHNICVEDVSRKLGQIYSEMIFVQGHVHCDPHPGNVLVRHSPRGAQVILLDHGLYQTLTDEFRGHYSQMWLSMINADIVGMKRHAEAMNVGHLYGLFACILTARSWTALRSGISRHQFSEAEDMEIKNNASQYLWEITDILNRIPRQLLLILRTNDLLRGIERTLKICPDATSFINMSRCCVRAVADDQRRKCQNLTCIVRSHIVEKWQLLRIRVYDSVCGSALSRFPN